MGNAKEATMRITTTVWLRAVGVGLALLGAAGCATTTTATITPPPPNRETSEAGNPNSVSNKDAPPTQHKDHAVYTAQMKAAEERNPNSIDNKSASPPPLADKQTFDAESRAAEHGNPHSVDDRMPTPMAILQRLHVFDENAIVAGKLASMNGGAGAANYGAKLVNDSQENEQSVVNLALKFHVALNEVSDAPARKELAIDQDRYAQMKDAAGPAFDRVFAKHIGQEQRRELDAVHGLRDRCVEAEICQLLARMEPGLQRSVAAADSLTNVTR
jgi:hypothetical protein